MPTVIPSLVSYGQGYVKNQALNGRPNTKANQAYNVSTETYKVVDC